MSILSATLVSLTVQLLIGALALKAGSAVCPATVRRRRAVWSRASRELWRAAPAALLVLGGAILLQGWSVGLAPRLEPAGSIVPGAFSLAGSISTSGCYLIWRAGRIELRGRRRVARHLARCAGGAILIGAAMLAALLVGSRIGASPAPSSLLAAALLGATGFTGVLAGLSGKPRPGGEAAIVFYLAAVALLMRVET